MLERENYMDYWRTKYNGFWLYEITCTVDKTKDSRFSWINVDYLKDNINYWFAIYGSFDDNFWKLLAESIILHFDPEKVKNINNSDYKMEEFKDWFIITDYNEQNNTYQKNIKVNIYSKYSQISSHFKKGLDLWTFFWWKTIRKVSSVDIVELKEKAITEWKHFIDMPQFSYFFEKFEIFTEIEKKLIYIDWDWAQNIKWEINKLKLEALEQIQYYIDNEIYEFEIDCTPEKELLLSLENQLDNH